MKKRTRVLALTVAVAMSASLLAGCSSSAQQGEAAASSEAPASTTAAADGEEDNIIRVGAVCAMTGGSAIYGEGAQNAIDMAVEEINAGDSGYKIEIVNGGKVADDAKDAKQAMNAYNKVMADSPEAIVGSFFSSVTLPMAEQASKDGMLLLATGATNADVTLKGDTIFRNCFIDPYQGKMAALFAKDKGFTKAAVIYAKDDDYSNGLKDAFIENCEANGIEVAYTGECMTTDTDTPRRQRRPWPAVQSFCIIPASLTPFRCWSVQPAMQALPARSWAAMPGMAPTRPAFPHSLMIATLRTTTPARTPPRLSRTSCRSTPKSTAPRA